MRLSNFTKGQRVAGFFRLCVCILIALALAMGGMTLHTGPVHAAPFDFVPPGYAYANNVTECLPFNLDPGFITGGDVCPGAPATNIFFWWAGPKPPWVHVDILTGKLWGCPPAGTAPGLLPSFQVGATGVCTTAPPPCCPQALPTATLATITLTVIANTPPPLVITPTWYPVAWENMPFTMTLAATGCSGTYNWAATGLPAGLTVSDPILGIISGTPAPGTCGNYNVTVTCTDTNSCCCPPVSAPFTLIVDCWANYLALMVIYVPTSCDFKVNIGPGLVNGQTNVVIDGKLEATLGGNQSQNFTSVPCQSHLVVVDQIVPGADLKTRFAVKGLNQIIVSDTNNTAFFDYAQEVLIDTGSDPKGVSQPPGAGWYAVGANFTSTTRSPIDFETQKGVKYLFRTWTLPDGSTSPTRDLVFTVNKAGTAVAVYDTYYLLQLKSDYPPFDESSWELKNSTATYDLALPEVPMDNIFGAIGGKRVPINPKGSHLMTGPSTQKLLFRDDYTIPIIVVSVVVLLIIGLVVFLILRRKRAGVSDVPAATVSQVPQPPAVAPKAAKITPVVPATVEKKALTEAESTDEPNFCPKCGAPVEKDAVFCKKCGKKLVKDDK